jgi:hypothetical protein
MELEKNAFKGAYFKALKESRLINDTRKYLSGRFNLNRFTMVQHVLMESLYSMSDLRNPSAIRLYLYLLRNITGFKRRIRLELNLRQIKRKLNMGSSIYKAIEVLKAKNMIAVETIRERKYIFINVYPDTWETKDKEIILEIVNKEIRKLKGESGNEFEEEEEQILDYLKDILENSVDAKNVSAAGYVKPSSSMSTGSSSSASLGDDELLLTELEDL